jgi:hypothetical protein
MVRGPDQAGESGAFRPITPSNLWLPELGLSEFGAPLLSPTSAAPSLGAENSREPYAEDLKRAERHFRRHGLLRSFKQTVIPAARGGLVNRAKHKTALAAVATNASAPFMSTSATLPEVFDPLITQLEL